MNTARHRAMIFAAGLATLASLTLAPAALAGRLFESGHDPEYHCLVNSRQCHFIKVALTYVRNGSPHPTLPVLVLDHVGPFPPSQAMGLPEVPQAIDKAFGTVVPKTVIDPRSAAFLTVPIDTAHWSAVYIASDQNCGGCDLNLAFNGTSQAQTPDSTRIFDRVASFSSFFDAGGGLMVGAGAGDSNPASLAPNPEFPTSGSANYVPYYAFVATSGAGNLTGTFTLTALGRALGLVDGNSSTDDLNGVGTHNSFGFPPAGSRLKVVETSAGGGFVSLLEDSDAALTTILSGPPVSTTSSSAHFSFRASEDHISFQCRIDTAAFAACSSAPTFNGITEGRHTLQVRTTDLVGNIEQSPKVYGWAVAFDHDGDGFTRFSVPADCNDAQKSIHPGAHEIPGNKVDENCDGFSPPFERVNAAVSFSFRFSGPRTTVSSIKVAKIASHTKLKLTCKGRGCAFKSKTQKPKRSTSLAKLFKGRRLGVGAKITLTLSKTGQISQVVVFTTRRSNVPAVTQRCQLPGKKKTQSSCPAFI